MRGCIARDLSSGLDSTLQVHHVDVDDARVSFCIFPADGPAAIDRICWRANHLATAGRYH
ncbi:hypothetical protein D3C73_1388220 [compost metagenome]